MIPFVYTLNINDGDNGLKDLSAEYMAASRTNSAMELKEFWKSTESNSTMDSDYSLSSLEIDLFDDMRASMQKSSKASNVVNSSCKLQSRTSTPNPRFSKRPNTTSSQRVKTLPASRRPKTTADGVGKLAKEAVNPSKSQKSKKRKDKEEMKKKEEKKKKEKKKIRLKKEVKS